MRKLILFATLFFCATLLHAQKIALIDKNLKQPILFTDSVTVEQVKAGYFPIETKNIDTFYANLKYITEILRVRQRAKMKSFELRAGGSYIKVSRVPFAYGDRYSAIGHNKINEVEAVSAFTDVNDSNKKNAENVDKLLAYLSKNKSIFIAPYEIHPKIYNLVVISE